MPMVTCPMVTCPMVTPMVAWQVRIARAADELAEESEERARLNGLLQQLRTRYQIEPGSEAAVAASNKPDGHLFGHRVERIKERTSENLV